MTTKGRHRQTDPPTGMSTHLPVGEAAGIAPVKIMLVDDHIIIREALAALLSIKPGLQIVGQAGSGREALERLSSIEPNLIITDLSMPGIHGIDLIREVRRQHPSIRIIVLTVHSSDTFVRASLEAGASGYVLKEASHSELQLAITSVMSNKTYLSPLIAGSIVAGYLGDSRSTSSDTGNPWMRLSGREREVLKLLAEGQRNKEIGDSLCISVRTVEKHRMNLMMKLGLKSAAALTAFAIEQGLVNTHHIRSASNGDNGAV